MCHRTTAWLPAQFDHTGVVSNCFACHDGVGATGKTTSHVPTTNYCEDCHSTRVFSPVTRVDHQQVIGACATCHNGVAATGKNAGHIPSSNSCNDCHTTIAWTPARAD